MRGRGSRVICARNLARFEQCSLNIVVTLPHSLLTLHAGARDLLLRVVAMALFQKSPTAFSHPAKTSNSVFSPAAPAATSDERSRFLRTVVPLRECFVPVVLCGSMWAVCRSLITTAPRRCVIFSASPLAG